MEEDSTSYSPARALLLCVALALTACSQGTAQAPSGRRLTLSPCRLEGLSRPARCGTYEVYEDRAKKAGRKVPLRVVVLPALAPSPAPDPLVLLAGGPGQAATRVAAQLRPVLESLNRRRDILLVDQRGTGDSRPLECELAPKDAPLAEQLDTTFREEPLRKCLQGYDADVRLYTTPLAMDDLDEVREALGYPQLNLYGVSYGTRAALVYMRQHPQRVRTALLDGVAPLSMVLGLHIPRDAQRALDLVFSHCEQDASCARTYPRLRERFGELLARLEQPLQVQVAHPLTGKLESLALSKEAFLTGVLSLLYSAELTALVPLALDRAERGDWSAYMATLHTMSSGVESNMYQGMQLSVICAEDAPLLSEEAVARETQGSLFGDFYPRNLLRSCGVWPRGEVPADYHQPVSSQAPVLLMSGELDPVTPPSWAEEAKKTLPRSAHVVVPGVGHNTLGVACVRKLMQQVVEQGSVEGLDTRCGQGMKRPPFFTSFAGPVAESAQARGEQAP
jgi:pimeloyl-ACP methyl ester carboxylesterase